MPTTPVIIIAASTSAGTIRACGIGAASGRTGGGRRRRRVQTRVIDCGYALLHVLLKAARRPCASAVSAYEQDGRANTDWHSPVEAEPFTGYSGQGSLI